jgi:Fe-S cluster biogenesis protein NfuA
MSQTITTPQLVADNPNPKAVSIEFPKHMTSTAFSQFSLPKSKDARAASPLFGAIFDKAKDVVRLDFIQNAETSSLSLIRKLLPWSEPEKQAVLAYVSDNMRFAIRENELRTRFNELVALDQDRLLVKMAQDVIDQNLMEYLQQDGGDIVLVDAPLAKDGSSFSVSVLMVGSCSGCSKSKEETLHIYGQLIQRELKALKSHPKFADHPQIQALNFVGIVERGSPNGFYSLKSSVTP